MSYDGTTVLGIVREWLKSNGYNGLRCDVCVCSIDCLMPCREPLASCAPACIASATCADIARYVIASTETETESSTTFATGATSIESNDDRN